MKTGPDDCGSSPAMIRISVDLPHPDAPTSARNSPSATSRSMPERTGAPPNDLPIDLSSTLAMMHCRERPNLRSSGTPRRINFVQHVVDPQRRKAGHVCSADGNVRTAKLVDYGAKPLLAGHVRLVVGSDQKSR